MAEVLASAQGLGIIGPGSVERHVRHAEAFADAVEQAIRIGSGHPPPSRVVDLGSGAGLPGLVLARRWPSSSIDLLEGSARRASFLAEALDRLGWSGRVGIVAERAEAAGRSPGRRGRYDAVVARSFGLPAVTAECGAPLLEAGGWLVVSEPPSGGGTEERWPSTGLGELGMSAAIPLVDGGFHFAAVHLLRACPDRFPRRVGVPVTRPLF
ncbi:MAG: RsmG family class I SAM-dependent methyltransferase [Thermoplasmata archaeon]